MKARNAVFALSFFFRFSHRPLRSIWFQIFSAITGLYVQYHSYEHWNTKTARVRSLYDRAQKVCINQHLFMTQVKYLKKIMSLNGYSHYIRTKIIKLLQIRQKRQQKNDDQDKDNLPVIFCRIPYHIV